MELQLLNNMQLFVAGRPIIMPMSSQRVLALLAVKGRPVRRSYIAGTLWPESEEERAAASLRSGLWRLRRRDCVVEASAAEMWLGPSVHVDLHAAVATAHRILGGRPFATDVREAATALGLLAFDLLPEWRDDWISIEREYFRQLRLHALEVMCERLTAVGLLAMAVQTGLAAVQGDPLRESAHRALMRAYAAEGNRGEVIRQFRWFRQTLQHELGLAPSAEMEDLIQELVPDRAVAVSFHVERCLK